VRKAHKIRSELIPPRGAKAVGTHTDGRVIYEMKDQLDPRMTEKVPVLDPTTGEEMWKKNPSTGEPMYPLMRAVAVYRDMRFVLERDGRGQVARQEGFEPTAEELAQMKSARDREVFAEDLAQEAVSRGLNAGAVLDMLSGGKKIPDPNQPPPDAQYPWDKKGGHWVLSDGSKFRGTRAAAEDAEYDLDPDTMEVTRPDDGPDAAAILEGVEITVPVEEVGVGAEGPNFDTMPTPQGGEE
jgi:hypothetical protein